MPAPKGKKKASGEKLMRANGRTKVVVWLDAYEARLITEDAAREGVRVATYVRTKACQAAGKSRAKERRRSLPLP